MTPGSRGGRGCLYHPALIPRTITAPETRPRHLSRAFDDPSWGERVSIALDVFDGSIRRAEALAAHLHRTGRYDLSGISAGLKTMRSLRGALATAITENQPAVLEELLPDLEPAFLDLGRAFCALNGAPADHAAPQCQNVFRNTCGPGLSLRQDAATFRHAPERQHA